MKSGNIILGVIYLLSFISSQWSIAQSYPRKEIDLDLFVQDLFGQQSGEANYNDIYESIFQYYRSPLDLNTATRDELEALYILSLLQIKSLLEYRNKNGKFLSEYELQAVPGFDRLTIEKMLPFVKIQDDGMYKDARNLWKRVRSEKNNYAIIRYQQTLEPQKGFSVADTLMNQYFQGGPGKWYGRYRIQQKNDFSMGITTENDAGEQMAWNPSRKQYGMDYYSAHFALYNKGRLKAIVIGDYNVMIGQGLVMAAGYYLGKGAETVTTVKRSNAGIRPYTGALESGFLRGVAATLALGRFDWTNFVSYKNIDGNVELTDTNGVITDGDASIGTSLYYTGLHRTEGELTDKWTIKEQVMGTHLVYNSQNKNLRLGVNGVYNYFSPGLNSDLKIYNQFYFRGKENYNFGAEFNYYWQNFNFFGEYSRSSGGNAAIAGIVASLHPKIDFSVLLRSYDRDFYSFYGNAFGELSTNRNERGIYWGIKVIPSRKVSMSGYYDKFIFPWLTSRSDAPSEGYGYLLRLNYTPTKKITLYVQYRQEQKGVNQANNITVSDYLVPATTRNYLINLDYKADKLISLKSRVQFTEYEQENSNYSAGIVILQDVNFDIDRKFKISGRFSVFDTDDYNSRVYVYEKNVLWTFALSPYYGRGVRNYVMLQYKVNRNLDIWLRIARFDYRYQDAISSGKNEISGNSKTDVTVQIKYDF